MSFFKKLSLTVLYTIVFTSGSLSQLIFKIDVAGTGGPDIDYKRGVAAPGQNGFFDSPQTREFLDYQRSIGMTIFNGIRNIYKDPPTNEFYYEDGVFKNQQIAKFTDIRKYAQHLGFEMISQVGGTPTNSAYQIDPLYSCSCPDYAPLPAPGISMSEFQRNFSEWAVNADKAVAPDFHSIWIGTQEITHTIGFIDDNATDAAKKNNIRRWIDYWLPITDSLQAAGAKIGGIQMNSSTAGMYQYAVDYMKIKKLKMEFLTYQFYQWGDTTDLVKAVAALNNYNKTYPGTQIIIDRGGYDKLVPAEIPIESSGAVIYFLVGEKGCMNYADKIYAYTLDRSVNGMEKAKNTILWQTKTWLNATGNKRRPLNNMPIGVDGFACSDDTKLSAAIWNRGASTRNFNIKLENAAYGMSPLLTVKKASGETFTNVNATWDSETQTISGISLAQYDFVLIDLVRKDATGLNRHTFNTPVSVYPNPATNQIHVSGVEFVKSLTLIGLDGSIVNRQIDSKTIGFEDVNPGQYVLKIEDEDGLLEYKKIIIN